MLQVSFHILLLSFFERNLIYSLCNRSTLDLNMAEDLDCQYSPSRWSKRFSSQEVIKYHVDFTKRASDEAYRDVAYQTFRYGENKKQIVDVFGTDLPEDAPLLVYIHGGYWQEMDRTISGYAVKPLIRNGIRVAVAGYDLAPQISLKGITQEIQQLAEFITDYGEKKGTKKICYAGHSAGAHLSAFLLKSKNDYALKGLILISGVFDLTPLVETYVNDALKLSRHEAYELSISDLVLGKDGLKILVAVGEYDSDEFKRQSKEFYEKMQKVGQDAELLMVKGVDHFDIVENLSDADFELTRKIINLIKKE